MRRSVKIVERWRRSAIILSVGKCDTGEMGVDGGEGGIGGAWPGGDRVGQLRAPNG